MMKRVAALVSLPLALATVATPQGRPVDWPAVGGDARRTGWERSDLRITKDNAKDFQLVLKRKFEGQAGGPHALTAPVVIGLLISYKGFKELGFVAGTSGTLYSVDLDLNKPFWQRKLQARAGKGPLCASGYAAMPGLTPPAVFGRRPSAPPPGSASPGIPATPAGSKTELPARVGGTGFGAPRPVYMMSADGMLHLVNTSDGSDQFPALKFLPPNAKASALTLHDNVVYTTTNSACGGAPNAVWALDMKVEDPEPVSFKLEGAEAGGLGGFAVGNDGTVYVQTGAGASGAAAGKMANTLFALAPKDLTKRGQLTVAPKADAKPGPEMNVTTPVVFEYKGRDVVVSAGADGRLYTVDSRTMGGEDGKTPLSQTLPIASAKGGIWGGLTTWEDAEGVRWVAAPVWGPLSSELKVPMTNGDAPNGSVVAFKLDEQNGAPVLVPAWVSRDLSSPVPPVVTSGVVFALSTGGYTAQGGAMKANASGRATFYALDAASGKELFTSGTQVTAPATLTGLTVANGRVFFTTVDSTLYGFGIHLEI